MIFYTLTNPLINTGLYLWQAIDELCAKHAPEALAKQHQQVCVVLCGRKEVEQKGVSDFRKQLQITRADPIDYGHF